ncbi:RNA helicase, partial [Salmonella enterica subsp. enterica serovar Schwarzengrund]
MEPAMNSIFYSVIILLLLTGAILFLMWEFTKKRPGGKIVNLNQTEPMT